MSNTDGAIGTAEATIAAWKSPATFSKLDAGPGVAVPWNVTVPQLPHAETASSCAPVICPNTQFPTVAVPSLPVAVSGASTLPLPAATCHCTAAPATGLSPSSWTTTTGLTGAACPAAWVWLSPVTIARDAAEPVVAVAAKVTGLPSAPVTEARNSCSTPGSPRVQAEARAIPSLPVVALAPRTTPPPLVTLKVTATPAFGVPLTVTFTAGAMAMAVCPTAVWPLPSKRARTSVSVLSPPGPPLDEVEQATSGRRSRMERRRGGKDIETPTQGFFTVQR